jgi:hypothetical protein
LFENPISQLVLIPGSMTTISLLLLSFRAITQVLIQKKSINKNQKYFLTSSSFSILENVEPNIVCGLIEDNIIIFLNKSN